ncbi:aromatic ring-hydroxylating dioxygenase subunit alpha [Pseudonocardia sp. ICBG601]|uniref:aromatic ring-hydroxylating dioxygenase subunit alpha n=1 Tax=Pseudonocardia sp. ICBG601 TaxID=2846759 RepID=UPI001CF6A36B|nr:aromatic ring-hydroxylating dioxygenase subunit alpha [Pseudonocardia sp. ICBG601]
MYPDRFPRNAWYVAARSSEVTRSVLSRWLLGDPVALYRREDGRPVALVDRCIHRQLPLSLGRLQGDRIECGYHGLTFDTDGSCVRIPGSSRISSRVRVQAFPLYEEYGLVWIWMGDPELADPTLVPDHHWFRSEGWATAEGTLHMDGRAQLLNENLLDLSHLTFLHPESIGSPEVAEAPVHTSYDERVVRVHRTMTDVSCPPFFQKIMKVDGAIDRGQVAEYFAPAFHISQTHIRPAGSGDDVPAFRQMVMHAITPETRTTTHYFWGVARNFAVDDPGVTDFAVAAVSQVFEQDIAACEAIEHIIAAWEPSYPLELNIKVDAGPLRARRIIEEMVAAEREDSAAPEHHTVDAAARRAATASRLRAEGRGSVV